MLTITKTIKTDGLNIHVLYRALVNEKRYGVKFEYNPTECLVPFDEMLKAYEPRVLDAFKKRFLRLGISEEFEVVDEHQSK